MGLKIFNTLTKQIEDFSPSSDIVKIYSCGPTVYNRAHTGNLSTYIYADTLRRLLLANKYKVKHVINITDVGHLTDDADQGEDKIEQTAKKENKKASEITEHYTKLFLEDLKTLNIDPKNYIFPKATDYIKQQIEYIKVLENKGYTYTTSDGVYFDTSKLKNYPFFKVLDTENLKEGARVKINSEKKNPTDFALWKFSPKDKKRQQEWNSPWGVGFPGWHIECSTMIKEVLGEQIDIHTGGIEHIPIHHNNEIAQSCGYSGKILAKYWLHFNHLLVEGRKMSKSLGNIVYLDDLLEKGYKASHFRYLVLSSHFQNELNFTLEALDSAKNAVLKLENHFSEAQIQDEEFTKPAPKHLDEFLEILNNNIDTPKTIAHIWEKIKEKDYLPAIWHVLNEILGIELELEKCINDSLSDELKELLEKRKLARENKDFKQADSIRDYFESRGYKITDTQTGQCVKKIK